LNNLFFYPASALKENAKKSNELNAFRIKMLIEEMYSNPNGQVPFDFMSLENKVALCAYIRACADESLQYLLPIGLDKHSIRLSPSKEYSYLLINKLFMERIIRLDSSNSILLEDHIKKSRSLIMPVETASFEINIEGNDGNCLSLKTLSELIEESLYVQNKNEEQQLEKLWKELALQEALEYLNFVLSERDFPFNAGEKTKTILRQVLTRYSISQAFYFIYSAAKNASDFYQSRGVAKNHAANTVPGKIQTLFDRSICENWNVSKYRRNYKSCPPSALSNVLYDKVLGLSPSGIDYIPGSIPSTIKEATDE